MLPETLSNDFCSLNPNEDKNVFSVLVEIDSKSNIIKTEFTKSLIKSNERMSYEEAQFVLKNNKENFLRSYYYWKKQKK